ncbi:MAG TPA: hypothetical protein VFS43_02625 [Polyangiaceae bacterium]|nr:hypothetical protein [Polyangiaceae bacterium]
MKLFLEEAPHGGAPGAINLILEQELSKLGWRLDPHHHYRLHGRDRLLPFASAERVSRLEAAPPADAAIYCDIGLAIRPPRRSIAAKNLVLFHGLVGEPGVWIANPLIDRYLALSDYVRDIARAILTMPDWRRRRCLDPRAFHAVDAVVAPLPCVERPDGADEAGGEAVPEAALRALAAGDVVGHAIQPRKADWRAVFSILLELNRLERGRGGGRRVRLVVFEGDYAALEQSLAHGYPLDVGAARAALAELGCGLGDLLIPSPALSQQALFDLFRKSAFGLAYNTFPEYFGFYVLESVFHGCPVYTNGIGNNRRSLPAGHGIDAAESPDMAFGGPGAYAPVARRIVEGLARPEGPRAACRLGRAYIERTYTRAAFAASLADSLGRALAGDAPEPPAFDALRVALNPAVRAFDPEGGRVVSDYVSLRLDGRDLEIVHDVLERRAGEVHFEGARLDRLQSLFTRGVLALEAPGPGAAAARARPAAPKRPGRRPRP